MASTSANGLAAVAPAIGMAFFIASPAWTADAAWRPLDGRTRRRMRRNLEEGWTNDDAPLNIRYSE
ncbi:hypothetical protein [Catenulispora rubra]|uniref:hypothetical protein n=1 Tax=Catenulispora rubra TaxID=280293 RepID=UPI001891F8DE|nr:hypothetical protein [Catenulispora rubra]